MEKKVKFPPDDLRSRNKMLEERGGGGWLAERVQGKKNSNCLLQL